MIDQVRVAVIGVGNNISALVQGIALYRATGSLAGIRTPVLDGLGVGDIEFVAAFATSPDRIGRDLADAILLPPNNFPRLAAELPLAGVTVRRGLTDAAEVERVAAELTGLKSRCTRLLAAAPRRHAPTPRRHCGRGRRSSTPPPTPLPATGRPWIVSPQPACRCWATT
jgi:myo-inositol-1-phosphate synthase